jgi:ANTAR domain
MTENEVLFQISNIVNGGASFPQAVHQIGILLEREASGKALFFNGPGSPDIAKLLDSFDHPYRSLYSVDVLDLKLTLAFASAHFQGAFPQRLADFVGEQLGMLLRRTRLAERRAQLKREIAEIEEDLATRKVMQRAEGILIARRGMTTTVARRWIAQQSHKTGLSKSDVADRIIAYYQATGLLEQRIA